MHTGPQTYTAELCDGAVLCSVQAATPREARRLAEGALSGHPLMLNWLDDGQIVMPAATPPRRTARRATPA
jgi:hypothetical protein